MGFYLNPRNIGFKKALNSEIYVDKSGLISYTNKVINTEQRYVLMSRPRRFGKSTAADMLCSYYSRGCDSREMFQGLKISQDASFEQHLNKYNVIYVHMRRFLSRNKTIDEMIALFNEILMEELSGEYPDIEFYENSLVLCLKQVFSETGIPFIFIIDGWDSVFRVRPDDVEAQEKYMNYLCLLLKGQDYVALAYMTGVLPIKKYGHHRVNMFDQFTMINSSPLQEYMGFTEEEVKELCAKHKHSFDEIKQWFDGYSLMGTTIYNPHAVVESLSRGRAYGYWAQTESCEALRKYIQPNMFGIQDVILALIAGESRKISTLLFANDMVTFNSCDDILTLLVHLGYLAYDFDSKTVRIPNYEIRENFISVVRSIGLDVDKFKI